MPNQTHCSWCHRELTPRQIAKGRRCCSNDCRRAAAYANGKATHDAMPEPYTDAEVAACNRMVADGKARVRRELDVLVWQRTPLDETPVAERRLRSMLTTIGDDDEDC